MSVRRTGIPQDLQSKLRCYINFRSEPIWLYTMEEKKKLCMVCAKPSEETICESCKAKIQGEAADKKQKIGGKVPVDMPQPPSKKE